MSSVLHTARTYHPRYILGRLPAAPCCHKSYSVATTLFMVCCQWWHYTSSPYHFLSLFWEQFCEALHFRPKSGQWGWHKSARVPGKFLQKLSLKPWVFRTRKKTTNFQRPMTTRSQNLHCPLNWAGSHSTYKADFEAWQWDWCEPSQTCRSNLQHQYSQMEDLFPDAWTQNGEHYARMSFLEFPELFQCDGGKSIKSVQKVSVRNVFLYYSCHVWIQGNYHPPKQIPTGGNPPFAFKMAETSSGEMTNFHGAKLSGLQKLPWSSLEMVMMKNWIRSYWDAC